MAYEVHILFEGYSKTTEEGMIANCSCTLIKGNKLVIVDTMTPWDKSLIVEKLNSLGVACDDIDYVSYKQHILETDPQRIQQIIERALEDASWVMKKYASSHPRSDALDGRRKVTMLSSVIHSETSATLQQFWRAIDIWNTNPHVVNRRLCGAISMFTGKLLDQHENLVSKIRAACVEVNSSTTNVEIMQILHLAGINIHITSDLYDNGIYIMIKKLMPRNSDKFNECLELFHAPDKLQNEVLFVGLKDEAEGPTLIPCFPYSFSYVEGKTEIHLKYRTDNEFESASKDWLKLQLFPKIIKWAESAVMSSEDSGLVKSLGLVDIVKYNQLYQHLKKKYGPEMVKIWPENTDPLKFVYEDVAIATYLLLLWEQERIDKGTPDVYQTFVDLGCGNGLLVHILTSEGHRGVGLDVRKRAIWDVYPSTTKLEVRSIVPSAESLFPDTDWLIGNHSDELTPWIPVIAARSSYNCRFFLLPCCSYEFNGQKYQRTDSSRSQYEDYLEYIHQLCISCGYVTKTDRLKIPSTKRICFVGCDRNFSPEDYERIDKGIQSLIDSTVSTGEQSQGSVNCRNSNWSQDFKPRENIERVRNCTQLDKVLIQDIVSTIAKELLSKKDPTVINVNNEEKSWNKGGLINIGDLVTVIPNEKLKKLKNECGGLQTLLKNNGNIFLVKQGQVQLKMPSVQIQKRKVRPSYKNRQNFNIEAMKKQKPCWFNINHPDGCPLSENDCLYKH
ncbi:hypothetical protein L9F63_023956 [Diploptera punctata]|uniref:tRNA (uracil-O(2)-)-methyltransferase n=1 Tax=Diploptera punctata TaxID=6984 RepID=A0AAD7ZJ65_DIPPU|nr:hypothetical protein L9F63_023956 [Diploptera punctata]